MQFQNSLEYAAGLDEHDPLATFRSEFYIPVLNGKEVIYFAGNSLGLQPKGVQDAVLDQLEDWASFGIEGYTTGRNPWMKLEKKLPPMLARIVGAKDEEIVVMNQLTANLHLMMATFYQPEGRRKKVIFEANAFSSDAVVLRSQMQLKGIDPDAHLIEVASRAGEMVVRNEDIIAAIREAGDELALVMVGGVNYLTGQVFFMKSITKAAHEVGAYCGFDLAHAAGNVEMKLHEWEVDFACWCSYKYLNSGPGAIGGVFIHERHASNVSLPRMQGWWGTMEQQRFQAGKDFMPQASAAGWQLSIAPVLSMATHQASLELFERAGFANMLRKSNKLSSFLLFILHDILDKSGQPQFEIITPLPATQRGCQISLLMGIKGKHQFEVLKNNGVITGWREPNILRIAPVPLYNTYQDVFYFGKILEHAIHLG